MKQRRLLSVLPPYHPYYKSRQNERSGDDETIDQWLSCQTEYEWRKRSFKM
jgi:hypothetical protein